MLAIEPEVNNDQYHVFSMQSLHGSAVRLLDSRFETIANAGELQVCSRSRRRSSSFEPKEKDKLVLTFSDVVPHLGSLETPNMDLTVSQPFGYDNPTLKSYDVKSSC